MASQRLSRATATARRVSSIASAAPPAASASPSSAKVLSAPLPPKASMASSRSSKQVYKITLRRSPIGTTERHKLTVKTLGLTRMHQTVFQPIHPAVAGKIMKVKELLAVDLVPASEAKSKAEQRQERQPALGFSLENATPSPTTTPSLEEFRRSQEPARGSLADFERAVAEILPDADILVARERREAAERSACADVSGPLIAAAFDKQSSTSSVAPPVRIMLPIRMPLYPGEELHSHSFDDVKDLRRRKDEARAEWLARREECLQEKDRIAILNAKNKMLKAYSAGLNKVEGWKEMAHIMEARVRRTRPPSNVRQKEETIRSRSDGDFEGMPASEAEALEAPTTPRIQ